MINNWNKIQYPWNEIAELPDGFFIFRKIDDDKKHRYLKSGEYFIDSNGVSRNYSAMCQDYFEYRQIIDDEDSLPRVRELCEPNLKTTVPKERIREAVREVVNKRKNATVRIDGVWLRGCGKERVEVLVEIDGKFVTIIPNEHVEPGQVTVISHYVHANGILTKLNKQYNIKNDTLIAGEKIEIGHIVYIDENNIVYPYSPISDAKENARVSTQSYDKYDIINENTLK